MRRDSDYTPIQLGLGFAPPPPPRACGFDQPVVAPGTVTEIPVTPRPLGEEYLPFDAAAARTRILEVLQAASDFVRDGDLFAATWMYPAYVSCRVLHPMAYDEGILEVAKSYYGSDKPGDPNYQGYWNLYRLMARNA
ncbi:MAG: hypothetical protein ABI843_02385 [Dokdonella sp.]